MKNREYIPKAVFIVLVLSSLCLATIGDGWEDDWGGEWEDYLWRAKEEKLKKNEAEYSKRFKKAPRRDGLYNSGYLERLEKSLALGLPYHTKKEEADFKSGSKKTKAEYHKLFGEPITDFELSLLRINLEERRDKEAMLNSYLSVSRTATGAVAKFIPKDKRKLFEAELSIEEWLGLARTLRKCRFDEWKKHNEYGYSKWNLELLSFGGSELKFISGSESNAHASNWDWDGLAKAADDIKSKMRKDSATEELESRLAAEHEKIFGKPIADFELSAEEIVFQSSDRIPREISVIRTATGASVRYCLNSCLDTPLAELGTGEWLEFANALRKIGVDKWDAKYEDPERKRIFGSDWSLRISSSDGGVLQSKGMKSGSPPNWNELAKAMYDVGKKKIAESEAGAQANLKKEYEKMFGQPISSPELSAASVHFYFEGKYSENFTLEINRIAEKAYAEYHYRESRYVQRDWGIAERLKRKEVRLKAELGTGEWLDFIRALSKFPVGEWKERLKGEEGKKCGKDCTPDWGLCIRSLDKDIFEKMSYENRSSFYPPEWDEFKKVMDDMVKKIKKKAGAK
ncbi:MAG: hypothetical protein LBH25_05675 [Fibromonadaceae bacterium]|jgi:hypothetical protein|nr:hypothetical protein [Fibromonadaceae bacterium]